MSIRVELSGFVELDNSLRKAQRQFPYTAERVLKSETRNLKKQITNAYVGDILKSRRKNWKKSLKNKPKTSLEKSFQVGQVMKKGNNYTNAVVSKAPHYHLVEDGHEPGGWYAKQKGAERVRGKKIAAKIMSRRSRDAEQIGERVLDQILKEAGLD